VNRFTASEIATLQSRLNKQLGPEYISTRPGNGGGKVAYLEGNKAIALANEVFGFNGWSSSLGQVQIDYVRQNVERQVFSTNYCRWTSFRTARSAWAFR
jgi:DNA recombination protein Rad52